MERKPQWIRTKFLLPENFSKVSNILSENKVHTVCREAKCPNVGECFSCSHLTFMILGDICTRTCRFCSVKKGIPLPLDGSEIGRIVNVVGVLNIKDIVITSVTRDDIPDGGAEVFAEAIKRIRAKNENVKIEILTPDFFGDVPECILEAMPDIWAHNIETVPELYKNVRPKTDYKHSIKLLKNIKQKRNDILTKSGIMLGLGEKKEQVLNVFRDLRDADVDALTIGQYLKPSKDSVDVCDYLTPDEFVFYKNKSLEMGFKNVLSAPLVRSSYRSNLNEGR